MREYKYIHRFRDAKGIYFILSNKSGKPNIRKAKFNPIGDVPTEYLKTISRDKINDSILRPMDEYVDRHYDESRDMFYLPVDDSLLRELDYRIEKKESFTIILDGDTIKFVNN